MKRLIGFLFVLTLAVSAFGIKIGEYTLSFDDTSNNFYSYRIGYKLRLDSIRIHGELNRMNLNALRYFALWGDVKGIDLSDCVIQGDSLPDDAFLSGYANGAKPRRESASIDDYDNSDKEFEIKEGQFVTDLNGAKEIDIYDLLYQSVILQLPNKKVCGINCKGAKFMRDDEKFVQDDRMAIFKTIHIEKGTK